MKDVEIIVARVPGRETANRRLYSIAERGGEHEHASRHRLASQSESYTGPIRLSQYERLMNLRRR